MGLTRTVVVGVAVEDVDDVDGPRANVGIVGGNILTFDSISEIWKFLEYLSSNFIKLYYFHSCIL